MGDNKILIVEDEPLIREIVSTGLSKYNGYVCHMAENARAAIDKLFDESYALIISDIRMPGEDGLWLLKKAKASDPNLAAIMLTAVNDVQVAIDCLTSGADNYLIKPINLKELFIAVERALEKRRLILENKDYQKELERKVVARTAELRRALNDLEKSYEVTLEALVSALDAREQETCNHSQRVAQYTQMLAQRLGIQGKALVDICRGALLHDIGKIGVPDSILLKEGKLTAEEWEHMKLHPQIGAQILSSVGFLGPAIEIVLSHQEHYDGKGYPRGLKGEEKPIGARIFAVADTFDCITSNRPYRKALDYAAARAEIERYSGSQFDPQVVEVFLSIPQEVWKKVQEETMQEITSKALVVCP